MSSGRLIATCFARTVVAVLWLAIAGSCSSQSERRVSPCGAGEIQACTHASGCLGTKTCTESGNFGACTCADAGSGGNAGSGGSAGASGQSGAGGDAGQSGTGGATGGSGNQGGTGGAGASGGNAGAAGTVDSGADSGSDVTEGGRSCASTDDCVLFNQYCAATGFCVSPPAGCANAVNAAPRQEPAPLLYDPRQNAIGTGGNLCRKDAACVANGNVCEFEVSVYDVLGDHVGPNAYSRVTLLDAAGARTPTFDVPEISATSVRFRGCFASTTNDLAPAIQIDDIPGHRSNAVCFDGSAP